MDGSVVWARLRWAGEGYDGFGMVFWDDDPERGE